VTGYKKANRKPFSTENVTNAKRKSLLGKKPKEKETQVKKQQRVIATCFKHEMARIEGEQWSWSGFRYLAEHRLDVKIQQEKCPKCIKEAQEKTSA